MAKKDDEGFSKELLDQLLAGRDPKTVLDSGGLLGELKKALAERMLNAEMDVHLENEAEAGVANHSNGSSSKTVLTPDGSLELSIPRDRHGRFDPALIGKYRRRFPGFDDKIIALYARGMSTRDIQGHVRELYGIAYCSETRIGNRQLYLVASTHAVEAANLSRAARCEHGLLA